MKSTNIGLPNGWHLICDIYIVISLDQKTEVVFIHQGRVVGKVLETIGSLHNRAQMIILLRQEGEIFH